MEWFSRIPDRTSLLKVALEQVVEKGTAWQQRDAGEWKQLIIRFGFTHSG
jgi:hypothetical protein